MFAELNKDILKTHFIYEYETESVFCFCPSGFTLNSYKINKKIFNIQATHIRISQDIIKTGLSKQHNKFLRILPFDVVIKEITKPRSCLGVFIQYPISFEQYIINENLECSTCFLGLVPQIIKPIIKKNIQTLHTGYISGVMTNTMKHCLRITIPYTQKIIQENTLINRLDLILEEDDE